MLYNSTRGGQENLSSAEVIKRGIAEDKGLFVPSNIPKISISEISALTKMTYSEKAEYILKQYLTDFSDIELRECIDLAYNMDKFDNPKIAPLRKLNSSVTFLELWHGPTCAFKDMALQILPHLLVKSLIKTGETKEVTILVATSGDTGKAALEGFKNVEGTDIIVFYPEDGVSLIQKMQMITQEGFNTYVVGVDGNFDDTQNGVKKIFTDKETVKFMGDNGLMFSSANSINWGRLVPQIVYYFSAYCDFVKQGSIQLGNKMNFVVPTGNFGNILAAYYAYKMGLPINKLICASNENNVLTDFINTGIYDMKRDFIKTNSPSMDILISSNVERLLYEISGKNSNNINKMMDSLLKTGEYKINKKMTDEIQSVFWGGFATQEETLNSIKLVYSEYKYVVDTHTAVAIDVYDKYVISTGDITPTVIVSTANPYKFNLSVAKAILGENVIKDKTEYELLDILEEETDSIIPKGLKNLDKKEIKHSIKCSKNHMKETVKEILKIE